MMAWALIAAAVALGAPGSPAAPPSEADCRPLPPARLPLSFRTGGMLEFDLDALGIAQAGKVTMRVMPAQDGTVPVQVAAQSNSLFSKIRRVKGSATTFLDPRTVHPTRYIEDATENEVPKRAVVSFSPRSHQVQVQYKVGDQSGQLQLRSGPDALDAAAALYLMRQLPLAQGSPLCLDVYLVRRLWRVIGKVEGRERVSAPVGELPAWHVSAAAFRLDDPRQRREIHLWISDDARRLPLAVVGSIGSASLRARLTAFSRPGEKKVRAQGSETLKW